MILSAITAVAGNNVIGRNNQLPWRLPADMKYFKDTTWGHPVIMGRKTYVSFGNKALKGRMNIVITRQPDFSASDARVVHSLDEAIALAKEMDVTEVFILGGADIYRQSMSLLNRIYLTRIYENFEGDAFFPAVDPGVWELVREEAHQPDGKNRHAYSFQVWEKKVV